MREKKVSHSHLYEKDCPVCAPPMTDPTPTLRALVEAMRADLPKELSVSSRFGYARACDDVLELLTTVASERPRADTSDVSSGPQAETPQEIRFRDIQRVEAENDELRAKLSAHASLVQEMETLARDMRGSLGPSWPPNSQSGVTVNGWYERLKACIEQFALLRRSTSKEPNPCPTCGAFLWGDTRPCWNCLRRSAAEK